MVPSPYPYSNAAIAYVEEQLADGLTLGSLVLRDRQNHKGVAQLCLCIDNTSDILNRELSLQDWHHGGIAKGDCAMECLIDVIHDFLRSGVNRLCIMENAVSKPSDAWLASRQSQVTIYQQEVYHILYSDSTPSEVERAIREARSAWMMLGYLIDLSSNHKIGEEFSTDEMKMMSQHVASCFMEAFDGEGYLLWEVERG